MEKMWRFASNNHSVEDGFNDSGIETFSANSIQSMVREVIQNSIDQQISAHPVVVEFELFQTDQAGIPGGRQLVSIFKKCLKAAEGTPNAEAFFRQAIQLMERPIDVLRVSDFYTTGLVGAETDDAKTSWHQLVKGRGSSNKIMASGGSFGIGKAAPLACSYFHTIFYASRAGDVDSYVGVSRLLSFEEEGREGPYTTIGTGFYSATERMNAILEPFGMGGFERTQQGTDIYILALENEKNLYGVIRRAVLENFFVAIEQKRLVVQIGQEVVDQRNLAQKIARLDDKKYGALKDYYDLLIHQNDDEDIRVIPLNAEEYGKEFGIQDGECTLLLRQGEDLNQRVLMTRRTGMTLFPQSRLGNSISYTGLLLIQGNRMNEIFKAMEMPAHDKWEPGHCKVNKKFYEKAYKDLRDYLRKKIKDCFEVKGQDEEIAYGMEEFFADAAGEGSTEVALEERRPRAKMEKRKVRRQRVKKEVAPREDFLGTPEVTTAEEKEEQPEQREKKSQTGNFKFRSVKMRLLARDFTQGAYKLVFRVPISKRRIRLEFVGLAEHGTYKLPVRDFYIEGTFADVVEEPTGIVLGPVKKGQLVCVEFSTVITGPVMMEVNYYETK